MTDKELFETKVIPVMNAVKSDLQHKQAVEAQKYMSSPAFLMAGGVGPDGGMAAMSSRMDLLRMTGEWNSKTVEDYISMVRKELQEKKISITPEIEKMMIDKMVKDQMPKSSIEYIMRKAAGNSIFGLVNELRKSPLQQEIDQKGEVLYGPSALEKGVGWGLGAAADFVTMGGTGVVSGLKFVGVDLALNAALSTAENKEQPMQHQTEGNKEKPKVPLVIAPGHEEEYLAQKAEQDRKSQKKTPEPVHEEIVKEEQELATQEQSANSEGATTPEQEHPQQKAENTSGWQSLLSGFGLDGFGDIGRNAGYILAMLPDILVGMFTGRTSSLGIKDNLMPIASIFAGMFVKNPLLKMTLIGMGGANLLNKAGHEELSRREGSSQQAIYRQYQEEQLDPRIENPQIQGNTMIATIDRIPVTITLPDRVIDAFNQGALPMSTLANAVLAKTDQIQQIASAQERFEQESRDTGRTIAQR